MSLNAPCPACEESNVELETKIDVNAQHATYFPHDPAVQRKLSKAAEESVLGYQALVCRRCGLTYASPMKAPGSAWYEMAYAALAVKPERRWEFDFVLGQVTDVDRVYEIGCGFGGFLAMCKTRGIQATGVDFSRDAVRDCLSRGLDAAIADLGLAQSIPGSIAATVVVSFHVLEHLEHPDDLFKRAAEVSTPTAILWVSVPSAMRPARLLHIVEPLDEPPHHLTKWTSPAFTAIGDRNGWTLDTVTAEPFSWRLALWIVASQTRLYQKLQTIGLFRRLLPELAIRATLYPWSLYCLLRNPARKRMSGFAMIAKYRRTTYGHRVA
jgi:SAM-dependent methyltransferase